MPDVDDRLRALGAEARWPATPDIATSVRAAIAAPAAARRPGGIARVPGLGRMPAPALVASLLVLVLAGVMAAAPGVRSELLERLGLEHASVTRVKRLPPTTLGSRLGLGRPVSLEAARAKAGFELLRPTALGSPGGVYLDRGAVTFTYGAGHPILFTQVRGTAEPYVSKLTTAGARRVEVGGAPGLVIEGRHVVIFKPPGRPPREAPSRLAATAVLWERDGRLLRLEGERPARELLRIARSVR
jgi:hypothetical protein